MKYVIGLVLVLVLAGGGYYLFTMNQGANPAGDTMLAGEEMHDNGMVGGDAMVDNANESGDKMSSVQEIDGMKVITVEGGKMYFSPNTITVKKGDKVKVIFKNVDGFHDFVLDEFDVKTPQITGPAEATVEFVADKAGTFEYYCSVGNHRAMGMKGTLTVTE